MKNENPTTCAYLLVIEAEGDLIESVVCDSLDQAIKLFCESLYFDDSMPSKEREEWNSTIKQKDNWSASAWSHSFEDAYTSITKITNQPTENELRIEIDRLDNELEQIKKDPYSLIQSTRGNEMRYQVKAKHSEDMPYKCKQFDGMIIDDKKQNVLPHCENCECEHVEYGTKTADNTSSEVGDAKKDNDNDPDADNLRPGHSEE